ncbi:hypothetical protein [Herbaspirillum sp.]|uniref:hypothetical protein n=1 Tax=Herbaspirillum sp. TaxID=1890675 RepID=UPI0025877188|nr:hypothetical protein [Herbaspirillum sp.]MCP3949445.1 hypothetical protein [Herbaspirillum sp.]
MTTSGSIAPELADIITNSPSFEDAAENIIAALEVASYHEHADLSTADALALFESFQHEVEIRVNAFKADLARADY